MKSILLIAAMAFAVSLPASVEAKVKPYKTEDIGREASCKWRAKKKYSAAHYLKRRAFIRECMEARD
jgi:hypothetical protein